MFERLRAFLSRGTATRSYDGATGGRRWQRGAQTPSLLHAQHAARFTLAARARYLATNNALAASAVEAWVSALVGTGIKPQSSHGDPAVREALNIAFEGWTDDADADGVGDLYALQALLVRRMVIDGEAFAILINDGDVLRVRALDPEQVDASLTRELEGGARIISGVEFDAAGRRVAYHIREINAFINLSYSVRRVPAADIIHLYRVETPGQVRGISWFAPVLIRLANLDAWADAQIVRQQVGALLTGFITSGDGTGQPFEGTEANGTLTGGLEPGVMKVLDPGQDVKFSDPANIGAEVIEFAKIVEREIAVGLGLPAWILNGDLSQANYGSQRGGLIEWRRRVEALQFGTVVFQALRPLWKRWATTEVLSGRVRTTVDAAMPAKWIVPKTAWIDPKKDAEAELMAIAGGLMSRREAVTARGLDIEQVDREIADDKARADALGLTFTAPANDNLPAAADEAAA
ncbi:phage portal protein [Aurantimonas coralicida]|uniref:phage portal protein n=1 Tax=Aurantimonas coralicida TaxID=182270 RepID=UPI001E4CBDBF|nr:phage portal protein [Aurantimonas coralicida]MCD1642463.1 phage portal protein [Aurantimonas coralicida]